MTVTLYEMSVPVGTITADGDQVSFSGERCADNDSVYVTESAYRKFSAEHPGKSPKELLEMLVTRGGRHVRWARD